MKEIVIKIPDHTYKAIKDDIYCGILDVIVYDAIKNGTELPKGHGRIVDMNETIDVLIEEWGYEGIEDDMCRVTTLVEADKGDAE